jgi:hypothetical protein
MVIRRVRQGMSSRNGVYGVQNSSRKGTGSISGAGSRR